MLVTLALLIAMNVILTRFFGIQTLSPKSTSPLSPSCWRPCFTVRFRPRWLARWGMSWEPCSSGGSVFPRLHAHVRPGRADLRPVPLQKARRAVALCLSRADHHRFPEHGAEHPVALDHDGKRRVGAVPLAAAEVFRGRAGSDSRHASAQRQACRRVPPHGCGVILFTPHLPPAVPSSRERRDFFAFSPIFRQKKCPLWQKERNCAEKANGNCIVFPALL